MLALFLFSSIGYGQNLSVLYNHCSYKWLRTIIFTRTQPRLCKCDVEIICFAAQIVIVQISLCNLW